MVNFTFVTHKGARPEKSELVKSHVMRESQRKRREAKQRRHLNADLVGQQPSSAETVPDKRDDTAAGHQQNPLPNCQIHLGSQDLAIRYPNCTDSLDSSTFAWPSSEGSQVPADIVDLFANQTYEGWDERQGSELSDPTRSSSKDWPLGEGVSLGLTNFYSALSQSSNLKFQSGFPTIDPIDVLRNQPSLLYAAFESENDPSDPAWMSQSLFNRVNELTAHYTSVLYVERPGLPPTNPVHYWTRLALVNSKILLSTALFYCAYRDTVRGMPGDDHHYFKDRILHLINLALENPATAVSDDNIAAVISMCMYENVRGGDLIATHLRGLRQMLDMRGGINNFQTDQGQFLSEMAILQDLMHSSCSNVPPIMFDIQGPILRDAILNRVENWYPQSPLRILNDAGFQSPISDLQSSFHTLRDAFDAFEMMCIEVFDPETAVEEAPSFKLRREKFWSRLTSRNCVEDEVPTSTKGRTEEVIHLAAKIHFRAVAFQIQHDDQANVEDMKRLYTIIRKIDPRFWKVAHYVYLWILLTGGAASRRHLDYRPHFVSEILRLGLSIGLFDWRSFRQTMGNFLWLQQFLRRNSSKDLFGMNNQEMHHSIQP